jgi:hypothetical protein
MLANANVLVGYDTSDDAAVYRLSNDLGPWGQNWKK